MKLPQITGPAELINLVNESGFLPFFNCGIEGYSLEECTPRGYWFVEGVDGPWEWKGRVIENGAVAYGKLFNKKTCFVSREWYPHLVNYRRKGYDFEGFYEDGFASYKSKFIMDLLSERGPLLSQELKLLGNYRKGGEKGFDTVITELQMHTFITVKAFEYALDAHGRPYGWGLARYALSEQVFGELISSAEKFEPQQSKAMIQEHIHMLCPHAAAKQIETLLR